MLTALATFGEADQKLSDQTALTAFGEADQKFFSLSELEFTDLQELSEDV